MKLRSSSPRKRTNRAIAACIVCMTAFAPSLSLAASVTVNYGFLGAPRVADMKAETTATTYAPVFKGIQTSTELDNASGIAQPVEAPGAVSSAKSGPKIGIGIDALMSNDLQIYTIPLSYAINRNFAVQVNLPVVTAKFDDNNDGISNSNTGIGDVSLTLKHRIGSENDLAALFSLVTAKFPSGDANKGLGTGTYDITLTEKVIKRFGDFRGTIMLGVTQPLNDPTIQGSKVEYGTTVAYMAALEHTFFLPDLWFGVRAEGLHALETRIDGIAQGNALTTLDLVPEFKYFFKRRASVNLGVNFPVYTDYALKGGSSTREVSASFGVSMMF